MQGAIACCSAPAERMLYEVLDAMRSGPDQRAGFELARECGMEVANVYALPELDWLIQQPDGIRRGSAEAPRVQAGRCALDQWRQAQECLHTSSQVKDPEAPGVCELPQEEARRDASRTTLKKTPSWRIAGNDAASGLRMSRFRSQSLRAPNTPSTKRRPRLPRGCRHFVTTVLQLELRSHRRGDRFRPG